jgi:hypothetical protein
MLPYYGRPLTQLTLSPRCWHFLQIPIQASLCSVELIVKNLISAFRLDIFKVMVGVGPNTVKDEGPFQSRNFPSHACCPLPQDVDVNVA